MLDHLSNLKRGISELEELTVNKKLLANKQVSASSHTDDVPLCPKRDDFRQLLFRYHSHSLLA